MRVADSPCPKGILNLVLRVDILAKIYGYVSVLDSRGYDWHIGLGRVQKVPGRICALLV